MDTARTWRLTAVGMITLTLGGLALLWGPSRRQQDEVLAARARMRAFEIVRTQHELYAREGAFASCGEGSPSCNKRLGLGYQGSIPEYSFSSTPVAGGFVVVARPEREGLPTWRLDHNGQDLK